LFYIKLSTSYSGFCFV